MNPVNNANACFLEQNLRTVTSEAGYAVDLQDTTHNNPELAFTPRYKPSKRRDQLPKWFWHMPIQSFLVEHEVPKRGENLPSFLHFIRSSICRIMPCGFSQLEGMQDVVDDFGHCDRRHRPKSERDRMVSIVELKCYLVFGC